MLTVQLNKSTENEFYGMKNCLLLYQNASKGVINSTMLNNAFSECDTKEKREMFFSLLFSIGDITARSHNIFQKRKVDSGGNAQRESFMAIVKWIKESNTKQFKKFLTSRLFNEFSSFDVLLANRVKTKKKSKKVEKVINMLSGDVKYLADYIASIIKGSNPVDKYFVAKFLTRPRLSKRKGHKTLLPETKSLMKERENFLKLVSEKCSLPYEQKSGYINFSGYYSWRKQYNGELESVLFSSKKIIEFTKTEFCEWLEKLPASARFRVRCRLLSDKNLPKSTKWGNLSKWFLEWETSKEEAQKKQRIIEEKVRQGVATSDEKDELQKVKKEAKVTVGAVNFQNLMKEIVKGTIDKIKIQPFLDKVSLPYNTLVFADDSGSMNSTYSSGYPFTPFEFATFMATICLMKNPDEIGRSTLGFFSRRAKIYGSMTSKMSSPNRILKGSTSNISEKLYDGNLHFLDNLERIRQFARSIQTSNNTDISSIPNYLKDSFSNSDESTELLQNFPVWTIISDGNFNNLSSPEASVNDFMRRCEMYFGFKPYLIVIDVANISSSLITKYQGIENFMYIPPNPAQIEQLLTNFKDIDVMDVYTPLQSLYRSNRYELVRKNTL